MRDDRRAPPCRAPPMLPRVATVIVGRHGHRRPPRLPRAAMASRAEKNLERPAAAKRDLSGLVRDQFTRAPCRTLTSIIAWRDRRRFPVPHRGVAAAVSRCRHCGRWMALPTHLSLPLPGMHFDIFRSGDFQKCASRDATAQCSWLSDCGRSTATAPRFRKRTKPAVEAAPHATGSFGPGSVKLVSQGLSNPGAGSHAVHAMHAVRARHARASPAYTSRGRSQA